jgi:hypothetical protein
MAMRSSSQALVGAFKAFYIALCQFLQAVFEAKKKRPEGRFEITIC